MKTVPCREPFAELTLFVNGWCGACVNCWYKLQVQHNSVELAMEWLINHPEEEAPAGQAAGGDAEGAGPEADIAGSFPQPAEEDVASSSTGPVGPLVPSWILNTRFNAVQRAHVCTAGCKCSHQLNWKRVKCHSSEMCVWGTGAT